MTSFMKCLLLKQFGVIYFSCRICLPVGKKMDTVILLVVSLT